MKKQLNWENKDIYYEVEGGGIPVMLVHGFAEKPSVWAGAVAALSPAYQVILPSLPGTGASDLISDMSMEGLADVLKAILEQENIKQVIMIGHSMGGYVSLAFAEKYAAMLCGWGLFHSTAYADTEEKKATRRKGMAFIREHTAAAFIQSTSPNLFSSNTRETRPALPEQFVLENADFSAEALIAYYEAMIQRPDRVKILKESNLPVFFAFGKEDNAIPYADSLAQCHLPAIANIFIFQESGHMGMLEEPEKAANALRDYLKQLYL